MLTDVTDRFVFATHFEGMFVAMEIFQVDMKIENTWNHYLESDITQIHVKLSSLMMYEIQVPENLRKGMQKNT